MRNRLIVAVLFAFGCVSVWTGASVWPHNVRAQGKSAQDWTTANGGAPRTAWIRTDFSISSDSMRKPAGFGVIRKMKFDNDNRQLNSLSQAILLNTVRGRNGFKSMGYVFGSS